MQEEHNNELECHFTELENTITPGDAFKSKNNFEKFIYEDQTNIFSLFTQLLDQPIRIITAQLTQSDVGFFNIMNAVKKCSKANIQTKPTMLWIVANEKEEWIDITKELNRMLKKGFTFYVIKASLEEENVKYTILVDSKTKQKRNTITDTKQFQQEYWERYAEICDLEGNPDFQVQPQPRHFQYVSIGKSGVQIVQTINTQLKMVASELFINNDIEKNIFDKIYANKKEIEAEFANVSWQRNEGKKSARIRVCINIDIMEQDNWKKAIKEQLKTTEKITKIICKYV